ncbi:MAG: methionine--tRNA ligase [Gammaproteobacteria bacterium]|jgi:methionyl-tRNA synthetase|nr:methionine--tRNA ligase [Gammaproteobacteria bacterium]
MNNVRTMIATTALPYANGTIHLGYILEAVEADIWVNFQKMRGNICYFIAGSDAHGTPVMIQAEKHGLSPEAFITKMAREQLADIEQFGITFDNFYTTHSPENEQLSAAIYQQLQKAGAIIRKTIYQAYDPLKNMFLPDRYVKGTCPRCNSPDQYGDNCEVCGATYGSSELLDPKSVLSGATPEARATEHLFFDLPHYADQLKKWISGPHVIKEIQNKMQEWFDAGLQTWDISRDAPYFGFKIPEEKDKYFYVWLDAPIGYMASFKNFCAKHPGLDYDAFWKQDSKTELYHFIGKDIVYFHTLFWPAVLMASEHRLPTQVFVHGFVTVNGEKMSKSRGTFITAKQYLEKLNPEYLRYYFAAKLNGGIEDIDLNFKDFMQRVNSDLIGKIINIAARTASFIGKFFDNQLATQLTNKPLWELFIGKQSEIADYYETRDYARVLREVTALADKANEWIAEKKPWQIAKEQGGSEELKEIATSALNLFRILIIYLKPVLPQLALSVESFLQIAPLQWQDINTPLLAHSIKSFTPLMTRIEEKQITEWVQ